MILGMIGTVVQDAIMEYILQLDDVQRKASAIALVRSLKMWLQTSQNSTKRAIAAILPFEGNSEFFPFGGN